jgi:ABC-2 type transport system ATP-binding protein
VSEPVGLSELPASVSASAAPAASVARAIFAPGDAPVLDAIGLSRRYTRQGGQAVVALDGLSFSVRPGEVVALLGPNGAGKTTAMLLALGLLDADAGEVRLFGKSPELLEVRRRIGFAPDAPLFPRQLTGLQVLELHGQLLGFTRAKVLSRAREVVELLGFGDAAGRPCGVYSKGQAQRLGLAQALLGEPELLFLDEPTAGLDPAGVAAMRELLLSLRAHKVAVLLNSHLLSEVEKVCDTVLFIRSGRLLRTHAVQGGARLAELRLANPAQVAARLHQILPDGVLEGGRLRVPIAAEDVMPGLVKLLVDAGAEVLEAHSGGTPLEQLYLEIVEGRT